MLLNNCNCLYSFKSDFDVKLNNENLKFTNNFQVTINIL